MAPNDYKMTKSDKEGRKLRYKLDDARADFRPLQIIGQIVLSLTVIAWIDFVVTTIILCATSWSDPPAAYALKPSWGIGLYLSVFGPIVIACMTGKYGRLRKKVTVAQREYNDYLMDREFSS